MNYDFIIMIIMVINTEVYTKKYKSVNIVKRSNSSVDKNGSSVIFV